MAIYRLKTVVAAAQELHLTQTAVTQRIQNLEKNLETTLFTRSRKGMTLTQEGNTLLKYCLPSIELEARIIEELRNAGKGAEASLCLSGPTSFISGRAVPACKHLYQKWPRLNLHFVIDDTENRLEALKRGSADVVVLYPHQVPNELDSKKLRPDRYYLVAHPPWQKRKLINILREERMFAFHSEDYTSINYLKKFNLLKFLARPRLFVNENGALTQLLLEGAGFGLLSDKIAQPFLESRQLVVLNEGRLLEDALALAWYPRPNMAAYFKELLICIEAST